jgi:hypothetical protein
VRLFSAWPELVDKAAARLLERSDWTAPAGGYPTGAEWADRYLVPLVEALGARVRPTSCPSAARSVSVPSRLWRLAWSAS